MTQSESPLLDLRNVSLTYRARPVLRGLRWRINPGEQWALLGPNGAGKTVLASIISGEQTHFSGHCHRSGALITGGTAYVGFERARSLIARDRKLDVSEFSPDATDRGTTVADLLPRPLNTAACDAWIHRLEMAPFLDRGLRYISTGQMRKALLASAILSRPGLLILDSPLDGLDAGSRDILASALETLLQSDQAVLLLAREMDAIPQHCSHILVLDRGRMVTAGPRAQVLDDPAVRQIMRPEPLPLRALPLPSGRRYALDGDSDLVRLRAVEVSYGDTRILHDINWTFAVGDHCCISGPNGCGKTTLLGLITGDNHKAYGQDVELFGRRRGSGESIWEIKQNFGLVDTQLQLTFSRGMRSIEVVTSGFFDSVGLFDDWTASQRDIAQSWLDALGLDPIRNEAFDTLSFGMQRMVLLARAMVKSPRMLVLDEPTLGLDGYHRELLLRALAHIVAASDTQLLFVSHSPGALPACINQHLRFVPAEPGFTVACERVARNTVA
ncbi:ATP-binding cassette domain-containing protein [Chromatocurvus halotolerans]|uniref:Molybdate transport system ATP-binding protein n=1 Tax=Chromatocurvus halotolerans TaxID=1132028 RepID=A0A4R2KFN8_9GAMM|nr:ATP-binding cassette domain-containing protein [Chromatocurvus halotolerans]TCO71884.1 molybdate transport system ATP-binding protein [Chromatocurvus halotolerans]